MGVSLCLSIFGHGILNDGANGARHLQILGILLVSEVEALIPVLPLGVGGLATYAFKPSQCERLFMDSSLPNMTDHVGRKGMF